MSTEKVLTDVPVEDVPEVVSAFESEGCTVETEEQSNGLWTVRAQCPDE